MARFGSFDALGHACVCLYGAGRDVGPCNNKARLQQKKQKGSAQGQARGPSPEAERHLHSVDQL